MESKLQENLEFLRKIRGYFGSRRTMWSVEYEFTGEEIIERRGGRIKNRILINDIVEVRMFLGRYQTILKANNSKMKVQMIPSLNQVILKQAKEINARKSEAELRQMEEASQETISRFKRANIIGIILLILFMFALALFVEWLMRKH
jgi:uncharacterized membrane protein